MMNLTREVTCIFTGASLNLCDWLIVPIRQAVPAVRKRLPQVWHLLAKLAGVRRARARGILLRSYIRRSYKLSQTPAGTPRAWKFRPAAATPTWEKHGRCLFVTQF